MALGWMLAALGLSSVALGQSKFFYAVENLATGDVTRRGTTTELGIPRNGLILAPDTDYRQWLLRAADGFVGFSDFHTPTSGSTFTIPPISLHPPVTRDADKDGLSDDAEFVLGTNASDPDTDRDGIADGAALQLGLDPGAAARTGIVGSTDTPGRAVDVSAFNDIVVLADSEQGIAVFNVFNRMVPLIIAQVDTPGSASAVAISGSLIAVANGAAGLAVVDVSDPPNARIVHQIALGGSASEVVAAGSLAYVAVGTKIVSVDLPSGTVLSQRSYAGGPIHDLALAGDFLYALSVTRGSPHIIYKIPLENGEPGEPLASLRVTDHPTFGRMHIAAGDGLIYVGSADNNGSQQIPGIEVIRDDGKTLSMIGPPSGITAFDVEPNGSGLVLFTGADPGLTRTAKVAVLDVRDPTITDRFLTSFDTPGAAQAIAIYNGLAYVADDTAGLQVINYLTFDTGKEPPTISLSTSFPLENPTNAIVEEGRSLRVSATVSDDVQVRNVEFYVDGVKVATDGNFPFEHRFTAPALSSAASFRLQARASDTGGRFTWSDTITVTLTPDSTPPLVRRTTPEDQSIVDITESILVFFNEPLDPTRLTTDTLQLVWAGPDQRFGTVDDVRITNAAIDFREAIRAAVFAARDGLSQGNYRFDVGTNVTDIAGNPLANPVSRTFWALRGGPDGDADHDGIFNNEELIAQFDPLNADTDGDGWEDGVERLEGADFVTNGTRQPRRIFLAAPPVLVDQPGEREMGLTGQPMVVARPPLEIALPGSDERGTSATFAATTIARPPILVSHAGEDERGFSDSMPVVARPLVLVSIPGQDEMGSAGGGIVLGKPQVTVLTAGAQERSPVPEVSTNAFLSLPKANLTSEH